MVKKKKGVIQKLLNVWGSIVGAILLIILGGSIAAGELALPNFLGFIPQGGVIAVGWTLVIVGLFDGITGIIAFITK